MDLPPSGWYPDPYGVAGLLRWWDGSAWTEHTHQDGGSDGPGGAEPAMAQPVSAAQPTSTAQTARVQHGAVPQTVPQPAVAQVPAGAQPTTVQPTTVQPTTGQPTTGQPATVQPAGAQQALSAGGEHFDPGIDGTQPLFLGEDAWTTQGAAPAGDMYGYQRAQRRRRIWLASGLAVGTVAALVVIALVVNSLAASPAPVIATHRATTHAPVAAATTPAPPTSATAPVSNLTDGQSGLSYAQLPSPWQPTCPASLSSSGFTWTAGESAIAGQVNGGQTTWYGAACSGPLPQQYGYNGVADLNNVATNLANQFNGSYYGALNHNFQPQVSQPVQVSGHAGWEVKFLITYNDPQGQGLAFGDELGAVVVVDNGSGVAPAVFYASIPGNLGENNVDTLLSSLQLTVTPQPSPTSPDAGGSPPSDGGGGNGP
ncbi:MAG TPA: DUF2510 domain-containing protein [Trebonia sp.]